MNTRSVIWALDVAALAAIVLIAVLVAPSLRDAQCEVSNRTTEVVFFVASWVGRTREIGPIPPSATMAFSVDAEAAVKFSARFSSGRELESEGIYFSRGMAAVATITEQGIDVRYGFETR